MRSTSGGFEVTKKIYDAKGDLTLRSTRRPEFDKWLADGVDVEGKQFGLNQHAYNSLFKSGRKDIMPDDIADALRGKSKAAENGAFEYVNPTTGTSVFANSDNKIVGVWPSTFKR